MEHPGTFQRPRILEWGCFQKTSGIYSKKLIRTLNGPEIIPKDGWGEEDTTWPPYPEPRSMGDGPLAHETPVDGTGKDGRTQQHLDKSNLRGSLASCMALGRKEPCEALVFPPCDVWNCTSSRITLTALR